MVTNSKVLTVSYGTFSCTLEGFDESFDTMKAIAEYFRDLAADDRYFGAEPPTPDAEMLTRIAEREIERRVQARTEEGTLVLSAGAPISDTPTIDKTPDDNVEEASSAVHEPAEVQDDQTTSPDAFAPETQGKDDAADDPVPQEPAAAEGQIVAKDNMFEEDFSADTISSVIDKLDDSDGYIENVAEAPEEKPKDTESVAAKLRRIRAVVARTETDIADDDFSEDEHAEDFMESAARDIEATLAEDDVIEHEGLDDAAEAVDDEDLDDDEPVPVQRKPIQARVIKMKRADFEDAISEGLVEEDPETTLSDEDEAELMAELAEVDAEAGIELDEEAELAAEREAAEAEAKREAAEAAQLAARRARRRARRAQLDEQPPKEDAVERLIDEANTKLDEPAGTRRRSAIAHLRAAVAATRAEKEAGGSLEPEDNTDTYKDDLASSVRPHKAKSAAPLKLVAAQRVDAAGGEEAVAVRPRRISPSDIEAAQANQDSDDFVEFAEQMGATELPEVLEAAASYLTFVEGREKFSRPMLMRLAYRVKEDRFEREAGLRSFGQLLRDKKIEKIEGGRFTVSETINFKPDDRAAG